ncbi:MAG: hypothetical protein JJU34_12110 [Lunatimonas sp.]|uniref:hypothetical protein n=1 Tax=Lunatimonas sp. TaxID=2060141 RepID=UPI00263A3F88|nr:hypothetical protein [Lunatimonas sp.]MCC5938016.1 hypothetical protein [Lunatimonas sp.]
MQASLTRSQKISTVKTSAAWLVAAVIFPILVHLIPPYQGIPIGAYLLPVFYIPLIALWLSGWKTAIFITILAPLVNFFLTGSPQSGIMGMLTIEVLLFTGMAALWMTTPVRWAAGPLSYVGAKVISSTLLILWPILPASPWEFFTNSLQNGAPGILILLLLNLLLVRFAPIQK